MQELFMILKNTVFTKLLLSFLSNFVAIRYKEWKNKIFFPLFQLIIPALMNFKTTKFKIWRLTLK